MEPDQLLRAARLWTLVILLAVLTAAALVLVDRRIKNDIVKEARALGEVIGSVRRGAAGAADQAGRGDGRAVPDGVDAVGDGPGTPPEALADDSVVDPATVDGLRGPPHRGGIHGG